MARERIGGPQVGSGRGVVRDQERPPLAFPVGSVVESVWQFNGRYRHRLSEGHRYLVRAGRWARNSAGVLKDPPYQLYVIEDVRDGRVLSDVPHRPGSARNVLRLVLRADDAE